MKIVLISTSAAELKGIPTGVWLEEVATPYYLFKEASHEVIIASPAGGPVPIDAGSMGTNFFTEDSKKFMHDATAVGMLSHSVKLSDVDLSTVDALYIAGGHGTCVDFIDNPVLKSAIESCYNEGKVVAADCHGPICLVDCVKHDGTPLVSGLKVTGFSDSEEVAVKLHEVVPFLLESKFKEQGALYEKAEDWNPKVVADGKLVTGQNPQSSMVCAKMVLEILSKA